MADAFRLEPRARAPKLQDVLQARTHDPLWLLGLQWRLGELAASDGGAPVLTELQLEQATVSRWSPGAPSAQAGLPYDPSSIPLETLVEREQLPAPGRRPLGLRAEAGLTFLRLLAGEGATAPVQAYRDRYGIAASGAEAAGDDPATSRFRSVVAGRVPDGDALYQDLSAALGPQGERQGAPLPAAPPIAAADEPRVQRAARAWLAWYAAQGFSSAAGTTPWIPSRMEYEFAVAARTPTAEVVLSAPEYLQGELDWDAFVVAPGATLGTPAPAAAPAPPPARVVPAPVRYRGMPSPRLWELEDARVDYGAVDTTLDQKSIAQMLLVEFALVFSNDWFSVPVVLDVGSVCRVVSLAVTDTFGNRIAIPHVSSVDGPTSPWRFFALAPDPRAPSAPAPLPDLFFLPPTLATTLSARPLEDVLLLRDEMANLAWAVERVVAGASGRRIDRYEVWQDARRRRDEAAAQPPAEEATGATPAAFAYRLGSEVPEHWIPFVPEQDPATRQVLLRRGALPRFAANGQVAPIQPLGQLLQPGTELKLFDEEVPREGARVTRAAQWARWSDGSTHLWIGRTKQPGAGEGSSGLRFDFLDDGTTEA
jgi:hypothetical protein